MPYCKADDAQTCKKCGALIADGYWPEHQQFHKRVEHLEFILQTAGLLEAQPEGLSDKERG